MRYAMHALFALCVVALVACGEDTKPRRPSGGGTPVPLGCGNGEINGLEECDGNNLNFQTCISLGWAGGQLACTSCTFNTSACTGTNPCGDGGIDVFEECDGANLGGFGCVDLGYTGGTLSCGADCSFNTSSCTGTAPCGDGARDIGEYCDGNDLGGDSCAMPYNYDGGTLSCNADCTPNFSACTLFRCGDGQVNTIDEDCDGNDLDGLNCQALGFVGGTLSCTGNCLFNTTNCTGGTCGNNQLDAGEDCDGNLLGGATCMSLGFTGGNLSCLNCNYNTAACTGGGGGANGAACTTDTQCTGGFCLLQAVFGWSSGYCLASCQSDADCGVAAGGGHCSQFLGGCVAPCTGTCSRTGYTCMDSDGDGRTECVGLANGATAVGGACTTVGNCAGNDGGICAGPDLGFAGGYCTLFCSSSNPCPTGSHCMDAGQPSICVDNCTSDPECRTPDYACVDDNGDGVLECWVDQCPCDTTAACDANCTCDPDCVPTGWTCAPSWYGAADGCDCGCSIPDPDCAGANICTAPGCGAPNCTTTYTDCDYCN